MGNILITGGTSGLGLSMVKLFLKNGYNVVATGRKNNIISAGTGKLTVVNVDFSDMRQTSDTIREICTFSKFDIVINNAGILSPPDFLRTKDGHEYSFQVNFLSHLLLDEIILKNFDSKQKLTVVPVVSMAYRIAARDMIIHENKEGYKPFKAYSSSKLYLALMCSYLASKYSSGNFTFIGFDPGIFRSEICRMQKKWFRAMYRLGAPFMKSPEGIASGFYELIGRDDLKNGAIYKSVTRPGKIPVIENDTAETFWNRCYEIIGPYL